MNKQQAAATELSWEVASELGSELGDDTPSAENWSKKEKPKQESLASYLANFEMPEVPMLQFLVEDFSSELRKCREHWKKKREQYKTYWTNLLKFKMCLDFFEIDKQELKTLKQKQQEVNRKSSLAAVTNPAYPSKSGFAGQGQNTQ